MINIKSRNEWGAASAKGLTLLSDVSGGWVSHWPGISVVGSDTARALQSIQRGHMKPKARGGQNWSDIAYHFAVDRRGIIWELRGWGTRGGATADHNHHTMALLWLVAINEEAPPAMVESARKLMHFGVVEKGVAPIAKSHFDYRNTQCPGLNVNHHTFEINEWLKTADPSPGGPTPSGSEICLPANRGPSWDRLQLALGVAVDRDPHTLTADAAEALVVRAGVLQQEKIALQSQNRELNILARGAHLATATVALREIDRIVTDARTILEGDES